MKRAVMKSFFYAVIFFLLLILSADNLNGQSRKFGLGIIIGEPTGISAKLTLSNTNALALGVGWSVEDYRFNGYDPYYDDVTRTHIHIDYLWYSFYAISSNGQFPLYYGVGGRINTGPRYSGTFAVRFVIGIEWLPRDTPIDIFIEAAPSLRLVSSTGFGLDAGIGARFFF
jgi:hypothetical protein